MSSVEMSMNKALNRPSHIHLSLHLLEIFKVSVIKRRSFQFQITHNTSLASLDGLCVTTKEKPLLNKLNSKCKHTFNKREQTRFIIVSNVTMALTY